MKPFKIIFILLVPLVLSLDNHDFSAIINDHEKQILITHSFGDQPDKFHVVRRWIRVTTPIKGAAHGL